MGADGIWEGGIPLQPFTKTEKLQLDANANPQVCAYFYFLF